MIEITINRDGTTSENNITLGNLYENKDEFVHFTVPQELENYIKYVIAVKVVKDDVGNTSKITRMLPITNDTLTVSTALTTMSGVWNIYLMCRENELDLSSNQVDISANDGEHVFISNGIIGLINASLIDKDSVENVALDENLQIVYDELLAKLNSVDSIVDNVVNIKIEEVIDENITPIVEAFNEGKYDGKTPQKGVDYFTESDKQEFINQVLASLPMAEGELF